MKCAIFSMALAATMVYAIPAAHADLSFSKTYNKVQIADNSPVTPPEMAPAAAPPAANFILPKVSGQDPFPLSSKFSRRLQRYTGINWLGATVASQAASMVLHHKIGGHVKVKLKTYSFTDLIAGKIKSVTVEVKDPKVSGIALGKVTVKSVNPMWYAYRKDKSGDRGLKNPVMLTVRADLNQKQIARALENPAVASKLHGLKLDLPGLGEQQLQVLQPDVRIVGDELKLKGTLVTAGGAADSGVPVTITARPKLVGDNQIVLDNMKVDSPDIVEPDKFADFTAKLLNPVVDFARMDRRDHAFRMDSLKVSGDTGAVRGDGHLLLVPKIRSARGPVSQMASTGNLVR